MNTEILIKKGTSVYSLDKDCKEIWTELRADVIIEAKKGWGNYSYTVGKTKYFVPASLIEK